MNQTFSMKKYTPERKWYILDAQGQSLGRLTSRITKLLQGKHKPTFCYNQDCGDFVIVINADRVELTGNKQDELLYSHSNYPGGLKSISREKMREDKPDKLIERVVWGMLPKTKLGRSLMTKLKVYAGENHPHQAQTPEKIELASL